MEKNESVNIRDLFEGAYLLCRGFKLADLTVLGSNGRKLVTFKFTGTGITKISDEYRIGRATVNVALLKFSMKHLKDQMFSRIREIEKKEREQCRKSQNKITNTQNKTRLS